MKIKIHNKKKLWPKYTDTQYSINIRTKNIFLLIIKGKAHFLTLRYLFFVRSIAFE